MGDMEIDMEDVQMEESARGYVMDFGNIFSRKQDLTKSWDDKLVVKDASLEDETNGHEWNLPQCSSLAENGRYLNDQLEMLWLGLRQVRPKSTGMFQMGQQLQFEAGQNEDEIRRIMDCMNYLLQLRRQEINRSSTMGEEMSKLEKENSRKSNAIQTLRIQLETEKKVRPLLFT